MFKLIAFFAVLAVAAASPGLLGAPVVATYGAPGLVRAAPIAYAAPGLVRAAPIAYGHHAIAAPVAYGSPIAYGAPVAYAGAPIVRTAYLG